MKKLLVKNRYFFIPYLVFLVVCCVLLLMYSKVDLHILLNKANSPFFDVLFKYTTYLGDGSMIAVLFIILLFTRYRYALIFLTASLLTALIVNILKKIVFQDMYRPSKYFEMYESYKLHFVEGVKLHSFHSFPSGHTATAFNLFLMLALMVKNKILKTALLIIAVLVAYSRVYISQHFIADIAVGSIIAVLFVIFAWLWFERFDKQWLDNSLIRRS